MAAEIVPNSLSALLRQAERERMRSLFAGQP
jgi:hypothetical protein